SVFKTTTRERWDLVTPLALSGLCLFGVCFIYSAQFSSHGNAWLMQLLWLAAGAVVYVAVSLVDYRFWLSVAHWFYLACLVPLFLVLIPGIGDTQFGAQRWIDLGVFKLQPS